MEAMKNSVRKNKIFLKPTLKKLKTFLKLEIQYFLTRSDFLNIKNKK
jgi:hypothetical protein